MKFNNHNVNIHKTAQLGKNVRIGDNTVIYANVIIEDNVTIGNNCVLGEPIHDYYLSGGYNNQVTTIGKASLIRSHTIVYSGSTIGPNCNTGHRVTIRENTTLGQNCSIGTLCDIQGYSKFGNYVRLHSNVHIGQNSIIENFVFIYPYVILTNDPTPPSDICTGAHIKEYAQITTLSVILPGIEIGSHALVGAGSVVTKDIPDYMLALGNPARIIKDVREIKTKGQKGHYPWPYNFERGMPWEGIGFDNWRKNQS